MFKISGKTVTAESLDAELKADLVPDGEELQCTISNAELIATYEQIDQTTGAILRTTPAHIKVEFMVTEKGAYQRKTAFKKYPIAGDKRKTGLEALALLDHILGKPLQSGGGDIDNSKYLAKCLIGGKVTAEFKIWEMNGKAGNWIGDVSTPAAHDAEIQRQAETAQPTATYQRGVVMNNGVDDFIDDIPF